MHLPMSSGTACVFRAWCRGEFNYADAGAGSRIDNCSPLFARDVDLRSLAWLVSQQGFFSAATCISAASFSNRSALRRRSFRALFLGTVCLSEHRCVGGLVLVWGVSSRTG